MRRLAGQPRAGDVVLHDVDGAGEHVEIAGRPVLRQQARGDLHDLVAEGSGKLRQHGAKDSRDGRPGGAGSDRLVLLPAAELIAVEVDRDDDVGAERPAERDRNRIDQAAVEQPLAVVADRAEDAGHGDRGAHGIEHRAGLEPDLAAGGQIRGDGGEGLGQILDGAGDAEARRAP